GAARYGRKTAAIGAARYGRLNELYSVAHAAGSDFHTIQIGDIPPAISLTINFKKGSELIKLPLEYLLSIRVHRQEGGGKVVKMQGLGTQLGYLGIHASHGVAVLLSKEGVYEVALPHFPGMDEIAPQVVTVAAGQETVLNIDL
ncbi:MAG: hypothetical protein ACI82F_003339, partial [Planctomycetota bacterium]